jgi:hypothetical protein
MEYQIKKPVQELGLAAQPRSDLADSNPGREMSSDFGHRWES